MLRTARTLAPVLAQTVRVGLDEARRQVKSRVMGGEDEPVVDLDVPAPAGVTAYARQVSAQRLVAAPREAVAALVRDLDQTHAWLTLHVAWRGDRPSELVEGATFAQQISLMDIPAQARWEVEHADGDGFALRGTGPMGITVGLWCTLVDAPGGTAVRLDGALDGSPVRGPVGLTAVRSVETALTASLVELAGLLEGSGAARLRVPDEPVRHEATGRLLDPTTPVLVGVGQVVVREPGADPEEPVELAVRALRAAAKDAGADVDLLAAADLVAAVPSASWTYPDQAGLVASLVGADDATTFQTSTYGGVVEG